LLRADPQLVALDLRLHTLGALVPDDLGDLLRVLLVDALLQADHEPVLLAGELRLARVQDLQRLAALDELLLEHLEGGLHPLLAVRLDLDLLLARPGDARPGAPEVETVGDLLGRLVQGVVDLLPVDLADDVEAVLSHPLRVLSLVASETNGTARDHACGRSPPPDPGPGGAGRRAECGHGGGRPAGDRRTGAAHGGQGRAPNDLLNAEIAHCGRTAAGTGGVVRAGAGRRRPVGHGVGAPTGDGQVGSRRRPDPMSHTPEKSAILLTVNA